MTTSREEEKVGFLYHYTGWGSKYLYKSFYISNLQDMKDCQDYFAENDKVFLKLVLDNNIGDRVFKIVKNRKKIQKFRDHVRVITFEPLPQDSKTPPKFKGEYLSKFTQLRKLDLSGAPTVTFENLKECIELNEELLYLGLGGLQESTFDIFFDLLTIIPTTLRVLNVSDWRLDGVKTTNVADTVQNKIQSLPNLCRIDLTNTLTVNSRHIKHAKSYVRQLISVMGTIKTIYGVNEDFVFYEHKTPDETDVIIHNKIDTQNLVFDTNENNRQKFMGPTVTLYRQLEMLTIKYGLTF